MELCEALRRMEPPSGRFDLVLDTDTYNEIDDQFAIAYILGAGDRINLRGLTAAPFFNPHSSSPADGMEKSYREIKKLLKLAGREELLPSVHEGSRVYLPDEQTPVRSDAAEYIAREAMAHGAEEPLYVAAIGAITNVASALLLRPEIAERIVVVWLGGNAAHYPHNAEFNCMQDVAAARVVFKMCPALVQLPCMGVVDRFATTGPELETWLAGKNPLCDYLAAHVREEAESYAAGKPWSRVIWDVTAVGWLLNRDGTLLRDRLTPRPMPQYDDTMSPDPDGAWMKCVWEINRDALFEDMVRRLICPVRE